MARESLHFAARHVSFPMTASIETAPAQAAAQEQVRRPLGTPGAEPLAPGRPRGWLGDRRALGAFERPPGPAALGDLNTFVDLARPANCRPMPLRRCGVWPPALCSASLPAPLWARLPVTRSADRLVDPTLQGLRVDSLDRVGAAVHSLVRHLRGLQDHPDRGRRILSGLSRGHGCGGLGRSQNRRSGARFSPVRIGDDSSHPAAGGVASLRDLVTRRARARLDVRGRCRVSRRLARARLPAGRWPTTRQAGADRRRDRCVRYSRQSHRLAGRVRHFAFPALAGRLGSS